MRCLQQLPKSTLPPDFATSIIDRLPPEPIIIRPLPATTKRWPSLLGSLAAVCTTAAVCVGIWLVGSESKSNSNGDPSIARNTARVVEIVPSPDATTPVKKIDSRTAESQAIARAEPPNRAASTPNVSTPATEKNGALAAPPLTVPNLETVIVPRIAEFFAPQALDQRVIRDSLSADLSRHDVHRIDLFCRDCNRGLERIQGSLRERGVQLILDPVVADMQKRKLRGWYLVYCDDLSAAEWSLALQSMGVADRKADERKPGEGTLEQLAVLPFTALDQRELVTLLGADPISPVARSKSLDPRRPLSEDTADQVAKAVSTPSPAKVQKRAVVAPLTAAAPIRTALTASRDLRQFAEPDRERRPGAIAVMLIIRFAS
jgi:hypothetical protein